MQCRRSDEGIVRRGGAQVGMIKIYNALKDAVKIVTDININTTGTSAPPPVDNSWIQEDAAPRRSAAPQRPVSSYQPNGLESAFSSVPSRPGVSTGRAPPVVP